jgi:hypothetical protein
MWLACERMCESVGGHLLRAAGDGDGSFFLV